MPSSGSVSSSRIEEKTQRSAPRLYPSTTPSQPRVRLALEPSNNSPLRPWNNVVNSYYENKKMAVLEVHCL
ncbi:hypothetical protein DM860_017353 [Cuscuta australis]|uniref:Uncharacterized protein n=1 Tax=Cuscuta australis TaxID=267555 RepID=A0A328DEC9_9ASTE|nr:hypothetical protein DM860_017353 [Cuscuta australis]